MAHLPLRIPKADIRKVKGPAIGELNATVRTVLRGGYEGMAENGHAPAPDLWERYLVGPETSSDPAD